MVVSLCRNVWVKSSKSSSTGKQSLQRPNIYFEYWQMWRSQEIKHIPSNLVLEAFLVSRRQGVTQRQGATPGIFYIAYFRWNLLEKISNNRI